MSGGICCRPRCGHPDDQHRPICLHQDCRCPAFEDSHTDRASVDGEAQGRRTLTIKQVQVRCQVSMRTVYNWIAAKKIEVIRTPTGGVRIFEDSLYPTTRKPYPRTRT